MPVVARYLIVVLSIGLSIAPSAAVADQHRKPALALTEGPPALARYAEQHAVPLADVLEAVARETDRIFAVSIRVPADITLGTVALKTMAYPELLQVLAANGLGATTLGNITTIHSLAHARSAPSRFLKAGETAQAGENVTRIFVLENTIAAQLVPVLRPLMPNYAHLGAIQSKNALILVDTFANTERIRAIVELLDATANVE